MRLFGKRRNTNMRIIAGLGNPGQQYANTRHNMGWLCLDLIAQQLNIRISRPGCHAHYRIIKSGSTEIMLLKPMTYMNDSGKSIAQAIKKYGVSPENLLVLYDDIDIPTGNVRVRKKGSAGTHNGMRSIIQHIKTQEFARIRIGIGAPRGDLVKYVLGVPSSTEKNTLEEALSLGSKTALIWAENGIEAAMLHANQTTKNS